MRTFTILILAMLAASGFASVPAAELKLPNVLWITAEDMSPDLGCYGAPQAHTPNLDRLAAEGVRFANAFAIAPVCAPSRSGIITGMYPTSIGTLHMRSKGVPPDYVKCFTEHLRAAGYYCTNNAKTDYNFDAPLTAWDENGRKAHWRNRPGGMPFFSVFNLTVTHEGKFHLPEEQVRHLTRNVTSNHRHLPQSVSIPPYYPDAPVVRADLARYQDLITQMDHEASELLRQLEEDGLASNTIVFFFSDHGKGLPRGKRWLYDSGVKVPLIIRWPGRLKAGSVRDDLVSLIDLAPTLLSLAGIPVPAQFHGRPILPDGPFPPRDSIVCVRDRMDEKHDMLRCVREPRLKYIRNFHPEKSYSEPIEYGEKTPTMQEMRRMHRDGRLTVSQLLWFAPRKPAEELYDTIEDPHEVRNLATLPQYESDLKRMRAALDRWMEQTGDLGQVPEQELQERMRPGGNWQTAKAPAILPRGGDQHAPLTVTLDCATSGASIAYRIDGTSRGRWQLYSSPVPIETTGTTRMTALACRLGYKDSAESSATFTIR